MPQTRREVKVSETQLPCWLLRQERPYAMDTGWVRGISSDLDGEALYRWAKQLERDLEQLRDAQPFRRLTAAEAAGGENAG